MQAKTQLGFAAPAAKIKPPPISVDYALNDRVRISELECDGRVTAIYVTVSGVQYNVRYFWDGTAKGVDFFGDELTKAK